jgi:plastocyanin
LIKGKPHFTTRRGFITAAGFGVVSLYGLWVAYGAAPLRLLGSRAEESMMESMSGASGEHGASGGPGPEEFRRLAEGFAETNKVPDGSVRPPRLRPAEPSGERAAHPGADRAGMAEAAPDALPRPTDAEAMDIYLMAYQWGYQPAVLRLEAGMPYRFRMMAMDVTHGASLQVGGRGHIIRLRAGVLVEQELRFARTGEYLVYCTNYCGILHDRMQGKIIVT